MQRRVVALVAAAVVVLGSVIVLMIRVRAAPAPLPDEVLAAAHKAAAPTERAAARAEPAARVERADAPVDRAPIPSAEPPAIPPPLPESPIPARDPEDELAPTEGIIDRGARLPREGDLDPAVAAKRDAVREAYDNGDYESARRNAEELLGLEPNNIYAKRVATVSACAIGDLTAARTHFQGMDANQQRIVARRCSRFGVTF